MEQKLRLMRKKSLLLVFAFLCLSMGLYAQSGQTGERKMTGGVFLGAGGISNFDAGTGDLALDFGAEAGVGVSEKLDLAVGIGFLANVGNNDAFKDRSLLLTPGLRYSFGKGDGLVPYVSGGYALSQGEGMTDHFGFVGLGATNWYSELVGLRFEARDYISTFANFFEVRISIVLR